MRSLFVSTQRRRFRNVRFAAKDLCRCACLRRGSIELRLRWPLSRWYPPMSPRRPR